MKIVHSQEALTEVCSRVKWAQISRKGLLFEAHGPNVQFQLGCYFNLCCVSFLPSNLENNTTNKQSVMEAVALQLRASFQRWRRLSLCQLSSGLTFCFLRCYKIRKLALPPPLLAKTLKSHRKLFLLLFCCQEACLYLLKHYDWCLDPPSQDLEYKWLPVSRPANPPAISFTRLYQTGSDRSDTD